MRWNSAVALAGLAVVIGALAFGVWRARQPAPLEEILYSYGLKRGAADATASLHHAEDVDDLQVALQYLSLLPPDPVLQRDSSKPWLWLPKAVLDAPEDEQRRYLRQFADGYQKGYAREIAMKR